MSNDKMEQKLKVCSKVIEGINKEIEINPAKSEWLQKLSDIVTTYSEVDSDDDEANEAKGFFKCEDCSYWFNPEKDNMYILNYKHSHKNIMEERTLCSGCFDTWGESYKKDGWKCDDFEDEVDECYGKHCSMTADDTPLKLVLGWNREYYLDKKRFKENLYCDYCEKQNCYAKCDGCFETYSIKDLIFRNSENGDKGLYGEGYILCKDCDFLVAQSAAEDSK